MVRDVFAGPLQTTLAANEVLVEIRVPIPEPGTGWAFAEFARRRGDFALAGAAALARLDAQGRVASARLALCGVGDVPLRLHDVERSLVGAEASASTLERIENAVRTSVPGRDDQQLSAESRREVAGEIARRALARAMERAARPA